eukprot:81972-Pleurochrysis_carterae.AAC.1
MSSRWNHATARWCTHQSLRSARRAPHRAIFGREDKRRCHLSMHALPVLEMRADLGLRRPLRLRTRRAAAESGTTG